LLSPPAARKMTFALVTNQYGLLVSRTTCPKTLPTFSPTLTGCASFLFICPLAFFPDFTSSPLCLRFSAALY
jgi:hypothetical protein